MKEPGSEEWIIQITHKAMGILVSLESDTSEWRQTISRIDAQRVWEKYPRDKPYGTREAYFNGEFGRPEPELTRAKEEQQLLAHGGDRHSDAFKESQQLQAHGGQLQRANVTLKRGNKADYIRARLKRDGKTELLAKIESGELSAHAAAVEAGFRVRMVQHPATVEGFIRAIGKHLTPGEQAELKERIH